MFIDANHIASKFIHIFIDGIELTNCISVDTDKNEATLIDFNSFPFSGLSNYSQFKQRGKLTFKLKRDHNMTEPFLTQLTTDKCFVGFID